MAHVFFRGSIHYHPDREQGDMKTDVVWSWESYILQGNRKWTDSHVEESLSKRDLRVYPTVTHFLQQGAYLLVPLWLGGGIFSFKPPHTVNSVSWLLWSEGLLSYCTISHHYLQNMRPAHHLFHTYRECFIFICWTHIKRTLEDFMCPYPSHFVQTLNSALYCLKELNG